MSIADSTRGNGPVSNESEPEADSAVNPLRLRRTGALAASSLERQPVFIEADELFRTIYTRAGVGYPSEVLAICSALAGEGKTTVAVGIAVTVAQDFPEQRVVLVETDFQRPVLADDFGVAASPGLIDCILGGDSIQVAIRPTYLENLHIVPVGQLEAGRGRALRTAAMAGVIDLLRQTYDHVVLDVPPMLANSDAALLTDLADGVIVVVRAGVTPMSVVTKAVEQLDEQKVRGYVLNGARSAVPRWMRRLVGSA